MSSRLGRTVHLLSVATAAAVLLLLSGERGSAAEPVTSLTDTSAPTKKVWLGRTARRMFVR